MLRLRSAFKHLASPKQFDQFLGNVLSQEERQTIAESFNYDFHARKIKFESHFRSLVLHQCTEPESLRGLGDAINNDILYQACGAHMDVSVAALSKAHAQRPLGPFIEILNRVITSIGNIPKSGKILRDVDSELLDGIYDLLGKVSIFDASTLRLPPKIAKWAKMRENSSGVKVQLRLSSGYGGLEQVMITSAKGNDNPYFDSLLDLEPGAGKIYLFDTGYFKIEKYEEIVDSGNHFVTILHKNISYQVVEELPLPETQAPNGFLIHSDKLVILGKGDNTTSNTYRILEVTDSKGERTTILTDIKNLSAPQLCHLKQYRWSIEIVFRWLKKTLKLGRLISYSPKGVILQVLMALIVYGLMVLYHRGDVFSPTQTLRKIKNSLHQMIYDCGYSQGFSDARRLLLGLSPPDPSPT